MTRTPIFAVARKVFEQRTHLNFSAIFVRPSAPADRSLSAAHGAPKANDHIGIVEQLIGHREGLAFPICSHIIRDASRRGEQQMCGRFTQSYSWSEVAQFLDIVGTPRNLQQHYNLSPTDAVEVVRLNADGKREMVPMRWDLIPWWWRRPLKDKPPTFNARVETVGKLAMFRDAFKERRCVVPVSGFYEWTGDQKARKPHLFTAADDSPLFAPAGLWERWRNRETSEEILSCTLITTAANEWMTPYHDRMPAMMVQAEIDRWLRGEMTAEELHAAPDAKFKERRVSTRINKSGVLDDHPSVSKSDKLEL